MVEAPPRGGKEWPDWISKETRDVGILKASYSREAGKLYKNIKWLTTSTLFIFWKFGVGAESIQKGIDGVIHNLRLQATVSDWQAKKLHFIFPARSIKIGKLGLTIY